MPRQARELKLTNRRPGKMLSYRQVKVGKYYLFARKINEDNNYLMLCNFIARVDAKTTISGSVILRVVLLYLDGDYKEQRLCSHSADSPKALVPLSKEEVAAFKRDVARKINKRLAEF